MAATYSNNDIKNLSLYCYELLIDCAKLSVSQVEDLRLTFTIHAVRKEFYIYIYLTQISDLTFIFLFDLYFFLKSFHHYKLGSLR